MRLFHHITVFLISEQEKSLFSEAGVEFSDIVRESRGESVSFDIGEDDPRWERVTAIIASLEERDGIPKKYRVQNLSMTAPTMKESMKQMQERVAAHVKSRPGPKFLDGYSGQSVDQLLSMAGEYRIDSLVLAFKQAIIQKTERDGAKSLSDEERIVLAIEALEREVNNGGYDQFFTNSSGEFVPIVVDALQRIGCKKTATITQRAIKALDVAKEEDLLTKLNRCDDSYYKSGEPIAERLFAFIKANKAAMKF